MFKGHEHGCCYNYCRHHLLLETFIAMANQIGREEEEESYHWNKTNLLIRHRNSRFAIPQHLYQNIKIFKHSLKLFACLLCLCVPSHKVTFSCYASLMPPVMSNILIYVSYLCVEQFSTLWYLNMISQLCAGDVQYARCEPVKYLMCNTI